MSVSHASNEKQNENRKENIVKDKWCLSRHQVVNQLSNTY